MTSPSSTPPHRASEEWRLALEISEAVYRLALPLDGQFRRLGDQLTDAAAALPPTVAQERAGEVPGKTLERALLALETLLQLGVRLQAVPEVKAGALLSRLDRLRRPAAPGAAPPAPPRPSAAPAAPAATPTKAAAAPPRERILEEHFTDAPEPRKPAAPSRAPAAAPGPPDRLFVDGSNFLGRAIGYSLGDGDSRERLMFRLQEYVRRHPAHKLTVFFDGQKTATRTIGGLEERVTSGLHQADDVIVDSIRALPPAEKKRCTLVTDDRGLASRVRNEGVRVESVAWLSARLIAPANSTETGGSGMSRDELSEWEDFFKKPPQRPGR